MERWQQIESLFQEALERDPAERNAWLREACQGDSDLRREVASLLASHQAAADSKPWAAAAVAKLIDGAASLEPGQCLGPYRIECFLAAGGMGQVYRATDTRLNREVAIKVSAARFSERFAREARVIASLNHPNICQLYDVGANYLVMELVEGPTLADRIRKGALPLEDALTIARQIAEALEAAHAKGVVHRDLKPGNVKVTPDVVVKVLDFGLAKAAEEPMATANDSDSPTQTISATRAGVILGTAAYMSPEQARGAAVDKRADIWAFGCVVYEMLSGKRPFQGETTTDILSAVLKEEPDWTGIPARIQHLLGRCLVKDPKRRLRDIGDAMTLVEAPAVKSSDHRAMPWALATAFAIAVAVISFVHFRERAPESAAMRFQISMPENVSPTAAGVFAVSPDGRKLVFAGSSTESTRLWVRSLDSLEAHPLPANLSANPPLFFWSPDSRFIAYWSEEKLRRVDLEGGPPQTICDWPTQTMGGSWNREGVILFGTSSGIMRVSAEGGTPVPVTTPMLPEESQGYPSFVEDGKRFFYLRRSTSLKEDGVYVGSLDVKPAEQSSKFLLATSRSPVFVPATSQGGPQVLFERKGALFVQGIDARTLGLVGTPIVIADQVDVSVANTTFGRFSASANGILIYKTGGRGGFRQLTWFDRHGKVLGTPGEPGPYGALKVSPDGTRAAIQQYSGDRTNADIWIMDLRSGTETRLTFDPAGSYQPVWSPDGTQVAYQSRRGGFMGIYKKAANGAGSEELIAKIDKPLSLTDWSRDGRYLLYMAPDPKTKMDVWVLPLEGDRKPFPALLGEANEMAGYLSPDDRFLAYRSDETGRNELYVQTFDPKAGSRSGGAGKWIVSKGSAGMARWRSDGKELLYLSNQGDVMAVPVSSDPVFQPGPPELLFRVPVAAFAASPNPGGIMDATTDNQKLLVEVPVAENARGEFTVVVNWPTALKR
jgi:Tol biopolymer transport system component/predicted Ser/Thr protein kinase